MIWAQLLLGAVGLACLFIACIPEVEPPKKVKLALLVAAAVHSAPLFFTVWKYAIFGGD